MVVPTCPRWMLIASLGGALASGCTRAPSPLSPGLGGSVGMPHRGVLSDGVELPREGRGYRWLRDDARHFGIARWTGVIERAAASVSNDRRDSMLTIGDLSSKTGGQLLPHLSHRSGRDVDLPFYVTTVEGAPVVNPGFIHFGADGLAWDEHKKRYMRLDVEREWLLIRALLSDPEARVQWIFVNHAVESRLVDYALARGEKAAIVRRAQEVMAQPHPGGPHDDHLHVRTACTAEDVSRGCEPSGPVRGWLVDEESAKPTQTPASSGPPQAEELARELFLPIPTAANANPNAVAAVSAPPSRSAPAGRASRVTLQSNAARTR